MSGFPFNPATQFPVQADAFDSEISRYYLEAGAGGTDFMLKAGATLELPWTARTAAAAGTPTVAYLDVVDGVVKSLLDSGTSEVETAGLDWADYLGINAAGKGVFDFLVKINRGTGGFLTTDKFVVGLGSAYNVDFDAMTHNLWVMATVNSGTTASPGNWYAESDNGTTDNDDKDTGVACTNDAYFAFRFDMSVLTDCKIYIAVRAAEVAASGNSAGTPSTTDTWKRVCTSTTFDMSGVSRLQPVCYMQRAASTRAHASFLDGFRPWKTRRSGS